MDSRAVSQYFLNYATEESRVLPLSYFANRMFDHSCVIPLRKENWSDILRLLQQMESLARNSALSLFFVLVVNDTTESTQFSDYSFYLEHLKLHAQQISSNLFLESRSKELHLLWVERFDKTPFNQKQGVGLARKIGCDIATRLSAAGLIRNPWIRTTDADATLPENYFCNFPNLNGSAVHFSFSHDTSSFEGKEALTLYEIFLRYYYLGLVWSGSPFAHPSIGSCLAINEEAYVAVRGFPDRTAGEDFHLLNKLRKQAPVHYISDPVISLKGRFSERVPFGTGRATRDIHHLIEKGVPYTLYHPKTFAILKQFLSRVKAILDQPEGSFRLFLQGQLEILAKAHTGLREVFTEFNVFTLLESSYFGRKHSSQRLDHFHSLFDGLKTLRFIRALGRSCNPDVPWQQALLEAPFLETLNEQQTPEKSLVSLISEEKKLFSFSEGAFSV